VAWCIVVVYSVLGATIVCCHHASCATSHIVAQCCCHVSCAMGCIAVVCTMSPAYCATAHCVIIAPHAAVCHVAHMHVTVAPRVVCCVACLLLCCCMWCGRVGCIHMVSCCHTSCAVGCVAIMHAMSPMYWAVAHCVVVTPCTVACHVTVHLMLCIAPVLLSCYCVLGHLSYTLSVIVTSWHMGT